MVSEKLKGYQNKTITNETIMRKSSQTGELINHASSLSAEQAGILYHRKQTILIR